MPNFFDNFLPDDPHPDYTSESWPFLIVVALLLIAFGLVAGGLLFLGGVRG